MALSNSYTCYSYSSRYSYSYKATGTAIVTAMYLELQILELFFSSFKTDKGYGDKGYSNKGHGNMYVHAPFVSNHINDKFQAKCTVADTAEKAYASSCRVY